MEIDVWGGERGLTCLSFRRPIYASPKCTYALMHLSSHCPDQGKQGKGLQVTSILQHNILHTTFIQGQVCGYILLSIRSHRLKTHYEVQGNISEILHCRWTGICDYIVWHETNNRCFIEPIYHRKRGIHIFNWNLQYAEAIKLQRNDDQIRMNWKSAISAFI